jgi:divinyl chlorophyllide a 8-vinyl-reductase
LAGAELRTADVCDSASLRRALRGEHFDVVVSCIASRDGNPEDAQRVDRDANLHLLEKAHACEAHFILLSAICVQKPRLAFQHAKLEFEQLLRESGLPFTIVRPTAYFKSLAGQVERLKRGKPFLVFGDGTLTACKPISEVDLARFMVGCIDNPAYHDKVAPIGGPGPAMTPRQQGEMLFGLLGKQPKFRSVRPTLLLRIARLLDGLGVISRSARNKAEFARIGHYYATESMLVWDENLGRYDAGATPEYGQDTLRDFYRRVLADGMEGQELGAAAVFDRQ